MTRINLIPVEDLYDQHLMAEYRELPRIFTFIQKPNAVLADIPKKYVMGKGHVKFFFNKALFLYKRQYALIAELKNRGFNINFNYELFEERYSAIDICLKNDYNPTQEDIAVSSQRIGEKLAEKPDWYRKTTY